MGKHKFSRNQAAFLVKMTEEWNMHTDPQMAPSYNNLVTFLKSGKAVFEFDTVGASQEASDEVFTQLTWLLAARGIV
jgi:hypothetical protein